MRFRLILSFAAPVVLAACANGGVMVGGPGVQLGIPLHRSAAAFSDTVADRLYLGRSMQDGGTVSDSAWAAFVAEVVTRRFPAGFTVYRAEGQWRNDDETVGREQTFVLEVVHPAGPVADDHLQEIADEYRRRFRQQSVLRVTIPARMRFYR